MTLKLSILPVYSEQSSQSIGSIHLLKHQVETLAAFNDDDVDVVLNTAMTGDGKSLAAYLPAFQDGKSILAMYPTNELVLDQYGSMPRYENNLKRKLSRYGTMYSERITQLALEHDTRVRLEEVRKLLRGNPILLTNPDLIHLMMSHQYGWGHMLKELPATIGAYFDYFLFDEFHVFGVPQIIAVMNMLGYLMAAYRDKPVERKKFVFLSATPSKLMDDLLARGGLRSRRIEGHYCSSEQAGYHCILQPCDLDLHEIGQDRSTEMWIEEHLEEIRTFFEKYEGSKAAILVYSVATARRIYARLKEYFEPLGISTGENTGLTHRDDRRDSFTKHILVGTSTVDIGVDFRINYLIFEAYNAGSFLQRFGRLGRHEGFAEYRAYALLPRFVLERLEQRFTPDMEVEREQFNAVIHEEFPAEAEFKSYKPRWGVVQAAQVLVTLKNQNKQDANDAFTEAVRAQYEQFYGTPERPAMVQAEKKYRAVLAQRREVIEELNSFRGLSPLSCGVWDVDGHLKTYDLFFLLANTEFVLFTGVDFLHEVRMRGLEERNFKDRLLYLKVTKYMPESQKLLLTLPYDVREFPNGLHRVQVLDSFTVGEPAFSDRDQVNRRLRGKSLTCILSDMGRKELKQRLNLGTMFPVQRLQDKTGAEFSVAFGQEALLLDSLLAYRKTKGDVAMFL